MLQNLLVRRGSLPRVVLGVCTATQDCVAERAEDLTLAVKILTDGQYQDDKVTVLMQLPDQEGLYLVSGGLI